MEPLNITTLLVELRLQGMLEALEQLNSSPDLTKRSFEEKLFYLLDAENRFKQKKRQVRMFKSAKLKQGLACLEDIDFRAKRGVDKAYLESLFNLEWIENAQHLILSGACGTGKSWIACAFGSEAIRRNMSVLYKRFGLLMEELEIARHDGTLPKLRNQLSRTRLLILDDLAMTPLTDLGRQDLLDLVEDRTGSTSIIITTQLPISKWHDYFGDPTYADAIMDRIIHRAHKIELKGDSMRRLCALEEAKNVKK